MRELLALILGAVAGFVAFGAVINVSARYGWEVNYFLTNVLSNVVAIGVFGWIDGRRRWEPY